MQLFRSGALSSKAKGSFLILGYQKSFSRLKLSTQLRNLKTFPEEIYRY